MSVESSVSPLVLLDLLSFLDEILMPLDSPPNYANDYLCKQLFSPEVRFSSAPIYVKFFGLNCAWIPCSR